MLFPVILSGGSGTRLWPISQPQLPKQFLPLTSQYSVLQETVLRLKGLDNVAPITFVCNQAHQFLIKQHLDQIQSKPQAILVEPAPKNTAPAIAVAAIQLLAKDPEAVMLILPSDHVITDIPQFYKSIDEALAIAEQNYIVTFGIKPTKPHEGYGYIETGNAIADSSNAFCVKQFVEKPSLNKASEYIQANNFYWNSGIFLFKAKLLLDELKTFNPEMLDACMQSFSKAKKDDELYYLDKNSFEQSPAGAIDCEVIEKTKKAAVIVTDLGWSDIGTWGSLWEVTPKDNNGNVVQGHVYMQNSHNCYVNTQKNFVAILGASDLIIIDTPNALLISHRKNEQDIKGIAALFENNTWDGAFPK